MNGQVTFSDTTPLDEIDRHFSIDSMSTTRNCIACSLGASYWLKGLSAATMGFILITLHDSAETAGVINDNLAVVSVLASVLLLVVAFIRLSGILLDATPTTSCCGAWAIFEFATTLGSIILFLLVSSEINETRELACERNATLVAASGLCLHAVLFCLSTMHSKVASIKQHNSSGLAPQVTSPQADVSYTSALEKKMQQAGINIQE